MPLADKVISLAYPLRDQAGEIFEHNDLSVAYLYESGRGLLPKIEQALEGHAVGNSARVTLAPPKEGFGAHDPTLTFTGDVDNVPPSTTPSARNSKRKTPKARPSPSRLRASPTAN